MGQSLSTDPKSIFKDACSLEHIAKYGADEELNIQRIETYAKNVSNARQYNKTYKEFWDDQRDYTGYILNTLRYAVLNNQYDFVKQFTTHLVIDDTIDIVRSCLVKVPKKMCISFYCCLWMFVLFQKNSEGHVSYKPFEQVSKMIYTLQSCDTLFDTMIKDLANINNAWWAIRGYVYPPYFSLLHDLMTGPFAVKGAEPILRELFLELLFQRSKANQETIGVYNNFLDLILKESLHKQIFFDILNDYSKTGCCTFFNDICIDLQNDNWIRDLVYSQDNLDHLNHLSQNARYNLKSLTQHKYEMYKIHTN